MSKGPRIEKDEIWSREIWEFHEKYESWTDEISLLTFFYYHHISVTVIIMILSHNCIMIITVMILMTIITNNQIIGASNPWRFLEFNHQTLGGCLGLCWSSKFKKKLKEHQLWRQYAKLWRSEEKTKANFSVLTFLEKHGYIDSVYNTIGSFAKVGIEA